MADLWTRISASRDYVTVFTVLGAALSLLLTQLGAATWQTISRILPAAAVVFAFLAWFRPRVFPNWRLLELCLYAGQRFPVTRSIDDALYCFWWAAWRRRGCRLRTFDVARLRVEAELLTGGKDRGGAASAERRWREHLEAMLNERRLMQYTSPADPRFRTEIPDCLPLTSSVVFPGVDHYFKTLASVGRVDGHFLSEVHVASAYVAPLYLLTGQLGHFDDNWRAIVHAYADVTSIHDPISDESLRHLRAFQFACWIVWGPSIPICTCSSWNHEGKDAIGFQLGYGDENTSVRWAMRIEQPQHSAEFTGMARHLDGRAQVALVPLDHYAGYDRARPFVIREITAGDADLPAVRAIYEAHFRDGASAMEAAALGSEPAGASRRRDDHAYHLWALRPTPEAPVAGLASFFTLADTGFGGYIALAPPLRGTGRLPLLLARIETQMVRDRFGASGWYIECGDAVLATFGRVGFYEVAIPYRQPPLRPGGPAPVLHLLYKPFGRVYAPPTLSGAALLASLRRIQRVVYAIDRPEGEAVYRDLAREIDGRAVVPLR